jgi:DNA-binding MarR family transcriptional regulator
MSIEYDRLHIALISCSAAHKKCSMQQFQNLDLSVGQPKVLAMLSLKEGSLQKDLAEQCHVEPATMTSILSKMLEKGLIYKEQVSVSGGKKAYSIFLTDKGHALAYQVNQIVDDIEIKCYQGFDDSDKKLLVSLLNRMKDNLDPYQKR